MMIVTNLYKMILNNMDLSMINKTQDIMLCGGAYLCLLLDVVLMMIILFTILFIILSIYLKVKTKKNIWYWLNLLIDEL